MEEIKINLEGNETETVTGSDTFNIEGDTDNATGSDNDTATVDDSDTSICTATTAAITETKNAISLETYIAIFKKGDIMQKRGMAVKMVVLALIERGALYTEKGYESTIELAEKEFHISAQTTRSYLQAAEKFYNVAKYAETVNLADYVDDSGNFKQVYTNDFTSIFADFEGNDFAPSVLETMRALPVETIETLLADNVINYNMSSRDIKKAIKPYRQRSAEKMVETATSTDNGAETVTGSDTDNGNDTENEIRVRTLNDTETSTSTETATGSDTDIIATLKAEIARLQAENEELKLRVQSAERETRANAENARHYINLYNQAVKDKENTEYTAKSHYKSVMTQFETIKTLQAENGDLTNENQRLIDNATAQAETIETLQAENVKLKNSNNSYKAANTKAKKVIDTLQAENTKLKTENDTLKAVGTDTIDNDTDTDMIPVTLTGSETDTDTAAGSDTDK